MNFIKNTTNITNIPVLIFLVVFIIGLFWLPISPVVNNDEYWIADAAYQIAQGKGLNVTTYPELYINIRANKLIGYSCFQSISIYLFGYNLFAIRLFSYVSIFIASWFFMLICGKIGFKHHVWLPLLFVSSPYVWHIGHVGRPEAMLLLCAMCTLFLLMRNKSDKRTIILLSVITAFSFMIYVLGVFIGVVAFIILLYRNVTKKTSYNNTIIYVLINTVLAIIFVLIQGWYNIYITYTGPELNAANLFGSYAVFFSYYTDALILSKLVWSTLLIVTVSVAFIFNSKTLRLKNIITNNIEILVYLVISLAFFIYLRRTNMYYVVLIIAGLHLLAVSLLRYVEKSKWLLYLVLGMNTVFVIFYSIIYPPREKIAVSENLKTRRIMAPIQFRDQLLDCNSFVAMEDYKGVLKTRQMAFGDYVKTHRIEYLLLDEFTEKQWYGAEVLKLAESNGELIDSGTMGSLGSRDYEDIPYFLSLRKAYSLMKERPRYRWKLYCINKQAKPFVSQP
jgi:hypothetical protein